MTKAVSTNSEGVYSVQSKMELGGAENFVAQRIFCRFDRGRVNDRAKKSVVEIEILIDIKIWIIISVHLHHPGTSASVNTLEYCQ